MSDVGVQLAQLQRLVVALDRLDTRQHELQVAVDASVQRHQSPFAFGASLTYAHRSFSSSALDPLGEHGVWASERVAPLRRQLAYARWLDSSTPGIQTTVTFPAESLPDLTPEQVKALAEDANDLLDDMPPIPQRLIRLVQQHGFDPDFAAEFEGGTSALARVIDARSEVPTPDRVAFDRDYAMLLEALSLSASVRSHLTDADFELRPPPGSMEDYDIDPVQVKLLSLLMSQGSWDTDHLVRLADIIIEAEREDPHVWEDELLKTGMGHYRDNYSPVIPGGDEWSDPMVGLMSGLSKNPEAAQQVFLGGGNAPIKVDGDEVGIPGNLRHLLLERGWPADGGISLQLALGAAFQGDRDAVQRLDGHLKSVVTMDEPKDTSWYSFAGHLGLDLIGFLPVLGEWADGVNASWYLGEGNYVEATLSGTAALPYLGVPVTITKWVDRGSTAIGGAFTIKDLRELLDPANFEVHHRPGDLQVAATFDGRPVPDDAVYLVSSPAHRWEQRVTALAPDTTYLLEGELMIRTDSGGHVASQFGSTASLTPAQLHTLRGWAPAERP